MTKKDIEAIEHVKAIMGYCREWKSCSENCIFYSSNGLHEDICTFDAPSPCDWEPPKIKTYKQDFLEKFPNAKINTDSFCICRKHVYPDSTEDCYGDKKTCAECWDEVYMEK